MRLRRWALLLGGLAMLPACAGRVGPGPADGKGPPGVRPGGCDLLGRDEIEKLPVVKPPDVARLPPAVDLREDFPPPGDQGELGSCVAFATTYALRSYLERRAKGEPLVLPGGGPDYARIFSPAFTYNNIPRGRNGGSTFPYALGFLTKYGALPWAEVPYDLREVGTEASAEELRRAERHKLGGWGRIDVKTRDIKAFLATRHPVLFGVEVDQGFVTAGPDHVWRGTVEPRLGGHAMILVGYDDAKNAFRVQNSWGAGWGDGGTGWIDYGWFQRVEEAYVGVRDASPDSRDPRIGPPGKLKKDEKDGDPAAGAQVRILDVAPRTFFEERRAHGLYVRVTGDFAAPNGAGKEARIRLEFFRSEGDRKGAPVALAGPEPGPPRSGESEPLPLPQGPFSVHTAHSRLDLPPGSHDLWVEPVLVLDGAPAARGQGRRFELEK